MVRLAYRIWDMINRLFEKWSCQMVLRIREQPLDDLGGVSDHDSDEYGCEDGSLPHSYQIIEDDQGDHSCDSDVGDIEDDLHLTELDPRFDR